MRSKFGDSGFTGCIASILVANILFQLVCCEQTSTTATENAGNANNSEIDYAALRLFGVSHEFADQFRLNLIKAIEAAKDEVDPLRQGEFSGVSGGFYQGGQGGGGGGGGAEEEEDDYEDTSPGTPGPGAFGVLSGLFGIFSGLGSLNPSRIVQSTVNFFPPGQRMQAQMIVDSLIGYTPPENRTARPRPRTRRPPTTPMTITDTMMKEVTEAAVTVASMKANETVVVSKDAENNSILSSNGTSDAMSEVVEAATEPSTTSWYVNVHDLLERSTTPTPPQNEDDEKEFEKRFSTTDKPKSNSSMAVYKLKAKVPENEIDSRGVVEEVAMMNLNITSSPPPPAPSPTEAITI